MTRSSGTEQPPRLQVICAGAVKGPVMELASDFEKRCGCNVAYTFGPVGTLVERFRAGEPADLLILNEPALLDLDREGCLRPGSVAAVARVGVGIAVRKGTPHPDISTRTALRQTLLSISSLAHGDPAAGDSSGIQFSKILGDLGIEEAVRAKTVLSVPGLGVQELLLQGKVELGATQASVIVATEGIELVGLLPADLQRLTTYAVGIPRNCSQPEWAERFLAHLLEDASGPAFQRAGMKVTT